MFGEYAQIASFLSPRDGYGNLYGVDAMPEYLRPPFQPPQLWGSGRDKSGLTEDFIMIAEFSELEGPKPLMTIPKDGGGSTFDQNSFAVRILAVDHQTSTQGFSISEDAQVVLSDVEAGVFAFVHHLVLYDNTARGFVRPHCIAYITTDQRKLMNFYEEMSSQFKKVARSIKYGNFLVFVSDLERHLKDLEHTKSYLLNQVSKLRLKESETNSDMRRNADNELYRKLQTIPQSSSEIKEILSILKPLLSDKRLEGRFRLMEEKAFQAHSVSGGDKLSLQEDWFNDLSSLDGLDTRCGSLNEPNSPLSLFQPKDYKPLLVETKKAKRFNTPLRNLHELCSWGAKEGLKKLRSVHEYFKRDMVVLEIERLESKLMRPACTSVYHGQCVTGNLMAGIHIKQYSSNPDEEGDLSMHRNLLWASRTSLESNDSFKSADSFNSAMLTNNNVSSGSGHDSLNGNFYQSAPSSLERCGVTDRNDYFDEVNKRHKDFEKITEHGKDVDKDKNIVNAEPVKAINSLVNEGHLLNDSCHSSDLSDLDEPPILIFKEKIKRPLSVVSLGCTDDEYDSEQGENAQQESFASNAMFIKDFGEDVCDSTGKKECCDSSECKTKLEKNTENVVICNRILGRSIKEKRCSSLDSHSRIRSNRLSNEGGSSSPTDYIHKSSSKSDSMSRLPSDNNILRSDASVENSSENIITNNQCNNDSPSCLSSSSRDKNLADSKTWSMYNLFPQYASSSPKSTTTSVSAKRDNPSHKEKATVSDINSTYFHDDVSCSTSSPPSISSMTSFSQLEPVFVPPDGIKIKEGTKTNTVFGKKNSSQSDQSSISSASVQRTDSIQSDYTDISIRDLFPYLADIDCNSPVPNDVQSKQCACDAFDSNDGTDTCCTDDGNLPTNSSTWRPRHGLYTVGDWLNNLKTGRAGYGIVDVLNSYSNLQHVVYSLMIGRPVLVVGGAKLEQEVLKVINALMIFIPSTKRHQKYVLEWTSKPLRISDLSKLRLIGLCRPDRKSLESFMPSAVKKASTVIDMEKKTIHAPQYQGQLIPNLLGKRKSLKSDVLMLSYIHWWMMDIVSKAFIFFHSFYLGSAGSMIGSTNLREHRDGYRATVIGIMGRLGVKDSDCAIVEYIAELTKMARLEGATHHKMDSDSASQPLSVQYTLCQTFKC